MTADELNQLRELAERAHACRLIFVGPLDPPIAEPIAFREMSAEKPARDPWGMVFDI